MGTYNVNSIGIEFLKDYKIEPNKFQTYGPYPIYENIGTYPIVEFRRKDPLGYIKLRNTKLWLHGDVNKGNTYFDVIRMGSYNWRQPLVCWFNYLTESSFVVYVLLGYGQDSITQRMCDRYSNSMYLIYSPQGPNIISWSNDMNQATVFVFDPIPWSDFSWIKLQYPPQ